MGEFNLHKVYMPEIKIEHDGNGQNLSTSSANTTFRS